MVDFRYHLVSITAIFLALATGIVIGTTALNGGVVHDLNSRVKTLVSDKAALRDGINDLQDAERDSASVAKSLQPVLVGGALAGRNVTVISMPGTDNDERTATADALVAAGATVSADIRVADKMLAPESSTVLDDLAVRLVPAGVNLPAGDPAGRAATVLGAVLGKPSSSAETTPAPTASSTITVLAAFKDAGMASVSGDLDRPGSLAVLLAGPSADDSQRRQAAGVVATALADALDTATSGVVVAGPTAAAAKSGVVAQVRGSAAATTVSTVDDLDRAFGPMTVVLALAEQLGGKAGQYGGAAGATAPLPVSSRS